MQLIIFDLDGTLIDSRLDLANSVNATLRHLQLPEAPVKTIITYVGDGARMLIQRALGEHASGDLVDQALSHFMVHYRNHCLEETRLYDGVPELLKALNGNDRCKLAVLTNKPVEISRHILGALGVEQSFFQVLGGDSFPSRRKPDPIGIQALKKEASAQRRDVLMVGDSHVDIETARNANVRSCGVLWGFRPDMLEDPAPDFVIQHPAELLNHLD